MRWPHGEPDQPLTDGVVTLRLPVAEDVTAVMRYAARPGGLEGGWLPLAPPVSRAGAKWMVADWLAGWAGRDSHNGPAFVAALDEPSEMVGMVGFRKRSPGVVEMVYGVAPPSRGRGLATRASRLAADWLARMPGIEQVELRIGREHLESQAVAFGAGFVALGTVRDVVQRTGETYEDLRFGYLPEVP